MTCRTPQQNSCNTSCYKPVFKPVVYNKPACCVPKPLCFYGPTGPTGPTSPAAIIQTAEYIRTIQSPNNSVPPGVAFTFGTLVQNNTAGNIVASSGAGGSIFTLSPGTYVIDYEMSLGSAGSIALYKGPNSGSLAIDTSTIAGSSTATTWIHGRSIQTVTSPLVIAVSSVVGTSAVVLAGTSNSYMIRITFLKTA
jgi:hypothetical protein